MIAPDVAALAAALHTFGMCLEETVPGTVPTHLNTHSGDAVGIIANLDALGGRITFAPEPTECGMVWEQSGCRCVCRLEPDHQNPHGWYVCEPPDDPVRAQGAPDEARRLLRGQFAYATSPETYAPGDFTATYDDVIDRALQAAVKAALEALRADVPPAEEWALALSYRNGSDAAMGEYVYKYVNALINAAIRAGKP